jgi:hypothetical protein
MLQFDNDGDKALCIQEDTIVSVAERNMKGIVPLYYEMAKAPAEQVNSEDIYKSLVLAYKANIGEISNNITKIWNSNNINLDVIKWLCMENNFVIDYAKTLFMPKRPDHVNKIISSYIKAKVPHFFVYAKDKELNNVEELNDSTVNKFEDIIINKRINFVKVAGKFDYKMLMKRKNVKLDEDIINEYIRLDRSKKWLMRKQDNLKTDHKLYVYNQIRSDLLKINDDIEHVVDVLVRHLYSEKKSRFKETLWWSFGDVLLNNLKNNIKDTKQCECCGERIMLSANTKKYCEKCAKEKEKIRKREWKRKHLGKFGSENETLINVGV